MSSIRRREVGVRWGRMNRWTCWVSTWWWLALTATASPPGVCPSMDIRNSASELRLLEPCRVIEGFLQVVLIDSAQESDFDGLVFPRLREVTGFVIFYNVVGLRSLGQLFPNLSVIRGDSLFLNFALSVFNLPDLQEISLVSLTTIIRGSVAIVNNPKLCFVKTVDWDLIGKGDHYFSLRVNSCPSCSKECDNCWNRTHCQITDNNSFRCHHECVGGCTGPGPHQCIACRHFLVNGTCNRHCQPNEYSYLNRHCVSKESCLEMHKTLSRPSKDTPQSVLKDLMWFTWNGNCVQSCPQGLERDREKGCRKCKGTCKKVCRGINVDSIQAAQTLEFCTHVNGSLEIQIRTGDPNVIAEELRKGLGLIEVIEGQLRIIRSFPLIDLSFFKSLRIIKGDPRFSDGKNNYSFVVRDNQNLQELLDWDRPIGKNFKIINGRLLVHFNPKLCPHYIEELAEIAKISNITDLEVARNSVGVNYLCNVLNLTVKVESKTENSFILVIEKPIFLNTSPESQDWLRFSVHYKEAPHRNITSQFDNDACSDDGWKISDVNSPIEKSVNGKLQKTIINHLIARLKPYTQYAFFVKIYSVGYAGGHSMIQYVRTLPSKPSYPENVQAFSKSSSEVVVRWSPPVNPNGHLKQYVIHGEMLDYDEDIIFNKDFCHSSHSFTPEDSTIPPNFLSHSEFEKEPCCRSNKKTPSADLPILCDQNVMERSVKAFSSFFHDGSVDSCEKILFQKIENSVTQSEKTLKPKVTLYQPKVKRSDLNKTYSESYFQFLLENDTVLDKSEGFNIDGTYKYFTKYIHPSINLFTINNLKHFSSYLIEVKACREKVSEESEKNFAESECSHSSVFTLKTKKSLNVDLIETKSIVVEVTNKTAKIFWKKPNEYNGIIVSYLVEFRRIDLENAKPQSDCISGKDFEMNKGHFIKGLDFGQYALRIRAMTLAGEGPFSPFINFIIEDNSYTFFKAIIIIVVLVSFIVISLALVGAKTISYFYKKRLKEKNILYKTVNPEYSSVATGYVEDEWELSRDDIQLVREIKQGNFGMVYEGLLLPENRRVAVKTVIESASGRDQTEFLKEATVMKSFSNAHHVVKLIGIVSRGQPILVIMELMALGDLKTFLRNSRNSPHYPPPSSSRLSLMAAQIADGMVYLEAYKFVHRDLAARNCMVSEDLTVKIGDFGMTRDIYETDYYRKGNKGLLPIRWMAPESLNDGIFTSHSDVWSYGVVLWEMVTLASQPYQGMSNEQVLQYVVSGNKLDTPVYCPSLLKSIMFNCWKWKPKLRPSFVDILGQLNPFVSEEFRLVSFYHSSEGIKSRDLVSNNDGNESEEQTSLLLVPSSSTVEFHSSRNTSC